MILVALVLDLVFLLVAFGARTWVQRRRTGDSGWRLGRPHSVAEGVARALLVLAGVALIGALVDAPDDPTVWWNVVGAVLSGGGIVFVVVAQLQMGASWRIGVDPAERTPLITSGIYRRIRNPIYTGMVAFALGQALVVPGPWSVAAVVLMLVGVEIQVRAVEEPYLRDVHGADFESWTHESGRFLPGH